MSSEPPARHVPMRRGADAMLRVLWRTQGRAVLVWVGVLTLCMTGTAASVAHLYDSPDKIHTYAVAVTSGRALQAINGRVEGIDTLGGVVQDEFGFLASILLPLLGVNLVARATRKEEETGRTELLVAGRVARHHPTVAALTVATAAIMVTAALFAVGMVATGIPPAGSLLYATSLAGLAFVFAGLTALVAQLATHTRTVYAASLLALVVSYVLRGIGDTTDTWVTWLSPLGWAERTAPFGERRWWALTLPLVVGATLASASLLLAARRDVGSGLIHGGPGPDRASGWLRRPGGFAVRTHGPAFLGWLVAALLFSAMMGALAHQLIDAMTGNPSLADAIGAAGTASTDGFVAVSQLYLAVIAGGYVVQAVGALPAEESTNRLEHRLTGSLSRPRWFFAHTVTVLAGLAVIVTASSLTLGVTAAWSVDDLQVARTAVAAGTAYLAADLVLVGLALTVFGLRPRAYPFMWAYYGAVTFVALLGPALRMPGWVLDLAPTTHVGDPPHGAPSAWALTLLVTTGTLLVATGVVAFRSRDIPRA